MDEDIKTTPQKSKRKCSTKSEEEVASDIDVEIKYDPLYCYSEPKLCRIKDKLKYVPQHFLRTHSKNNDMADVQTQIWQCCFEPDLNNPHGFRNIIATCGGTSICFIDVESGKVVLKYNRETKGVKPFNMYALAWSSIPIDKSGLKRTNILAAGCGKTTVLLFHPEAGVCYCTFRSSNCSSKNSSVCSLLFHPKKSTWLFCGHEGGNILLWDIGDLSCLPNYSVEPECMLTLPPVAGDPYNMVYSQLNDLLITGCDHGLYAWEIDLEKMNKSHRTNRRLIMLPDPDKKGQIVDSLCLITDDVIAAKCVLHGYIYLFKMSTVMEHAFDSKTAIQVEERDVLKLKWSDTDNYYMNMGVDKKSCILVCGDDIGMLWVYNVYAYITGEIPSPLSGDKPISPVKCSKQIEWPRVKDPELDKARKLKLDTYDIVVDKCAVSEGAKHIVAVTSNNLVCIWKKEVTL